jgi:hypothetical protein
VTTDENHGRTNRADLPLTYARFVLIF